MEGKVKNIRINTYNKQSIIFSAPDHKEYLVLKEGLFCNVFDRDKDNFWRYITSIKIEDKVTAQKIWEKIQI